MTVGKMSPFVFILVSSLAVLDISSARKDHKQLVTHLNGNLGENTLILEQNRIRRQAETEEVAPDPGEYAEEEALDSEDESLTEGMDYEMGSEEEEEEEDESEEDDDDYVDEDNDEVEEEADYMEDDVEEEGGEYIDITVEDPFESSGSGETQQELVPEIDNREEEGEVITENADLEDSENEQEILDTAVENLFEDAEDNGSAVEYSAGSDDYTAEDYADMVIGPKPVEDPADEDPCLAYPDGCCADTTLPAHGPRGEGCCLSSEFGCCPDNLRPAGDASGAGCGCDTSQFGCCPDGKTAQRGDNGEGCGCAQTEFGCCQDEHTPATGPDYDGCPCHTFQHGCCGDGETVAEGPSKENCGGCESSEFGCCSDGVTPAPAEGNQGCDCAGSEFGCCPDGVTPATHAEFEGCNSKPGEACHLKQTKGTCEDFSVKWYFDLKEGRCSRFWYGGCEGNSNRFEDSLDCETMCVNPPGSAKCYLPKVEGICTGNYERFYYDATYKQCVPFLYGGCLGNANRFMTKLECEQSCVRSETLAVCEQPLEPGPCMGNFTRWYYDEQTGECEMFSYGGCQGNQNRFVSEEECSNSCRHQQVTLHQNRLCKQTIEAGSCNQSLARWGFDQKTRLCRPFYYSGCEGNSNNFGSVEECETECPNAFPPELEIVTKILNTEEGKQTLLEIQVEGNPFPKIVWHHNSEVVEMTDRFEIRDDRSLIILNTSMADSGSWEVMASNGMGKVVRKQISLSVYPSQIPIQVEIEVENTTFVTGANIRLTCKVEGYPIPQAKWYKNNARLPKSTRIVLENEKSLVINNASPIDGGVYICRAVNEKMQAQAVVDITVLQGKKVIQCQDHPRLANCKLIVRAKFCGKNDNFAKLCCKSCVESGQIVGPPSI